MPDTQTPDFRKYQAADFEDCLDIFDSNCPEFFAPNERKGYLEFLAENPDRYEVCLLDGKILGAFGTWIDPDGKRGHVSWIMIDAAAHGTGLGTRIMQRALKMFAANDIPVIDFAASQKSAPFFSRFGAEEKSRIKEGWGPGLDRVNMQLEQ